MKRCNIRNNCHESINCFISKLLTSTWGTWNLLAAFITFNIRSFLFSDTHHFRFSFRHTSLSVSGIHHFQFPTQITFSFRHRSLSVSDTDHFQFQTNITFSFTNTDHFQFQTHITSDTDQFQFHTQITFSFRHRSVSVSEIDHF